MTSIFLGETLNDQTEFYDDNFYDMYIALSSEHAHADAYLSKLFDIDTLQKMVTKLLIALGCSS